jgi:hypothetical protein
MAPKYHPTPLSGADRKALGKELVKSRAMTGILAERSQEKRRVGEALIREADNLACQSWNENMWSDGGPAQPSPTIGQAINGGLPCIRASTPCSKKLYLGNTCPLNWDAVIVSIASPLTCTGRRTGKTIVLCDPHAADQIALSRSCRRK